MYPYNVGGKSYSVVYIQGRYKKRLQINILFHFCNHKETVKENLFSEQLKIVISWKLTLFKNILSNSSLKRGIYIFYKDCFWITQIKFNRYRMIWNNFSGLQDNSFIGWQSHPTPIRGFAHIFQNFFKNWKKNSPFPNDF